MSNKIVFNEYFKQLRGAKLSAVGRCANMAWLIFQRANGVMYSLHIQCPFRLTKENTILLANGDMYVAANQVDEPLIDWDVNGINLFDKRAEVLPKEGDFVVCKVSISRYSDLCIRFENKSILRVFISNSADGEQWRLFEKSDSAKEHLVAYPLRIEFE